MADSAVTMAEDLAALAPLVGVTADRLLAAAMADPLERAETIGALARASLVTVAADQRLRVHRLVQAATRDQLSDEQAVAWAAQVTGLLQVAFPGRAWEPECWSACAGLAAHVEAVVGHAEGYRVLAGRCGALLGRLGIYLATTAQHDVARATLKRRAC